MQRSALQRGGPTGTMQPCLRRCQPCIRYAQPRSITRNVRMRVASPDEVSETAPTSTTEDAFAIASQRLSKLLEEASWDSNEAVRAELSTYSPGMKLTFLTNCGSLLTLIAFGVSWITGEDPLGGVTLTSSSLDAAYVGALAAIPLVSASLLTRTTPLRGAIPLLEDLHATQAALLQPLLQGLNPSQLLIAASSTMLPTLLLLLPAMHGLAFMLSDMTSSDVVQPVLAAGTAAAVGAQETGMLLSASSSAALAHVDLSQLAVVGGADITLAQTTMTAAVNPTLASSQAVLGSHAQHAADSAASGIHLPWANPAHTAQTPVPPTSVATALPPAPAMPLGQGEEMWAAYDRALLGPQADAAAVSSEAASPSVWRALPHLFHSAALHKPALLPQGVPDLGGSLRDGLMGLLEPHTAYMVRNVAREALALLPAILSGFVAAYTVMRQVAPRRSQVWAIRDALMASDRYFRLTVSMSRGTAVPSDDPQDQPPRPFQETITMESLDTLEEEEPTPGPVPATIPIHTTSASSTVAPMGLRASSPAPHMHRLQLVDQLACPPNTSARAPPPPSSAAASAAVSDAFRKVAVLWLLTRRKVCQLAYMLTALNIVYFAILWQETNDLATPAVAAVISVVTELWLTQREAGVDAGPEQRL